jgi:hypothetical protein
VVAAFAGSAHELRVLPITVTIITRTASGLFIGTSLAKAGATLANGSRDRPSGNCCNRVAALSLSDPR